MLKKTFPEKLQIKIKINNTLNNAKRFIQCYLQKGKIFYLKDDSRRPKHNCNICKWRS